MELVTKTPFRENLRSLSRVVEKANVAIGMLTLSVYSGVASAIDKTDLTQDMSGGKTFDDVATNIDEAGQSGATLIINLVAIGGFVVVAISLYTLYKASKDEREKPLAAFVGLFIGGAMAVVGSIMWIMANTVIGK